jgi:hypothetical protein
VVFDPGFLLQVIYGHHAVAARQNRIAAHELHFFDHEHRGARICRFDRGGIARHTGPDDDDVCFRIPLIGDARGSVNHPGTKRGGCRGNYTGCRRVPKELPPGNLVSD